MLKVIIYALVFLTIVSSGCEEEKKGGDEAVKERCTEKMKENCECTMQYDPVCGCNGKTYGNACEAECHGIVQYTKGPCN